MSRVFCQAAKGCPRRHWPRIIVHALSSGWNGSTATTFCHVYGSGVDHMHHRTPCHITLFGEKDKISITVLPVITRLHHPGLTPRNRGCKLVETRCTNVDKYSYCRRVTRRYGASLHPSEHNYIGKIRIMIIAHCPLTSCQHETTARLWTPYPNHFYPREKYCTTRRSASGLVTRVTECAARKSHAKPREYMNPVLISCRITSSFFLSILSF